MRELKFRGKNDNGTRCFGGIYKPVRSHNIHDVEQFTGMYDCNGKEIYEGDIIKVRDSCCIAEVVFKQGCWCVDNHNLDLADERFCLYDELKECDWEVVGNIHDNPELRKKVRKNETD